MVHRNIGNFQLIDVTDPYLMPKIRESPYVRETCDYVDGWWDGEFFEFIRQVIRRKFFALVNEGKTLPDEDFADLEQHLEAWHSQQVEAKEREEFADVDGSDAVAEEGEDKASSPAPEQQKKLTSLKNRAKKGLKPRPKVSEHQVRRVLKVCASRDDASWQHIANSRGVLYTGGPTQNQTATDCGADFRRGVGCHERCEGSKGTNEPICDSRRRGGSSSGCYARGLGVSSWRDTGPSLRSELLLLPSSSSYSVCPDRLIHSKAMQCISLPCQAIGVKFPLLAKMDNLCHVAGASSGVWLIRQPACTMGL